MYEQPPSQKRPGYMSLSLSTAWFVKNKTKQQPQTCRSEGSFSRGLSGCVRSEDERAQFSQSITVCGKKISLGQDKKQKHKQSRWNTLVLGAMREPPAIPALWCPPQITCTPSPFLKPKGRKAAFAHISELQSFLSTLLSSGTGLQQKHLAQHPLSP